MITLFKERVLQPLRNGGEAGVGTAWFAPTKVFLGEVVIKENELWMIVDSDKINSSGCTRK